MRFRRAALDVSPFASLASLRTVLTCNARETRAPHVRLALLPFPFFSATHPFAASNSNDERECMRESLQYSQQKALHKEEISSFWFFHHGRFSREEIHDFDNASHDLDDQTYTSLSRHHMHGIGTLDQFLLSGAWGCAQKRCAHTRLPAFSLWLTHTLQRPTDYRPLNVARS